MWLPPWYLYTLRPIYVFSRIFGGMPFSITRNAKGEIQDARVSAFDLIWFIASICLYLFQIFIYYQNMKLPQQVSNDSSYMLLLANHVRSLMGLVLGIIVIAADMYNRFKFVAIFNSFIFFDKEVNMPTFIIHFLTCRSIRKYLIFSISKLQSMELNWIIKSGIVTFYLGTHLRSLYIWCWLCFHTIAKMIATVIRFLAL